MLRLLASPVSSTKIKSYLLFYNQCLQYRVAYSRGSELIEGEEAGKKSERHAPRLSLVKLTRQRAEVSALIREECSQANQAGQSDHSNCRRRDSKKTQGLKNRGCRFSPSSSGEQVQQ